MADVELVVNQWLDSHLDGVRVCDETPADLAQQVPLVKVTGVGGTDSDNGDFFEFATIVTESFAASRQAALDLAKLVKQLIRRDMKNAIVNGGLSVVAKTQTISLPAIVPYDNTDLRRCLASYRVFVKSRAAA